MAEPEWANGGIISGPAVEIALGEREQVIYPDGRIACVYGGQLYGIANRRWNPNRYNELLKAINDWKPDNG